MSVPRERLAELALLDTLFAEAPVGLAFFDRDLRYRRINGWLAEMNGLPPEAHIGRRIPEILPELPATQLENDCRRVLETGSAVLDQEVVGETPADPGRPRHWLLSYFPVPDPTGEIVGLGAVVVEVTERRRAEAESEALAQSEARATARATRLQGVTAALSGALTVPQVADVVVTQGLAAVGADAGSLVLLDEGETTLEVVRSEGYSEEVRERWRSMPVEAPVPIADAVRSGRPVFLSSESEFDARYPALRSAREVSDSRAWAAVPLLGRTGPLGALGLSFEDARTLDAGEKAYIRALVEQCAQALERARLYEREHSVAETLQRSLLPERLPDLPALELSACYRPAPGGEVGGDWYDVVPLADGRVALVIGDVVGHGVPAAALMGQLRSALRAYLLEGHGPATAAGLLNGLVRDLGGERMTTLAILSVDPEASTVHYALAGHPPPLLVRPDGAGTFLEGARSVPLGTQPRARFPEATAELPEGSALVLYTDGFVERREEPLDVGLERLRDTVAGVSVESAGFCGGVVERMLRAAGNGDDAALLALRTLPLGEELSASAPARADALASLRRVLRRWLRRVGAEGEDAYDLQVACGEAMANVVEHAYGPGEERTFELHGVRRDDEVTVTVRDQGRWRPKREVGRGRGLSLMEAFMDDVAVSSTDTGTEVRLRRRLRALVAK